MKRKGFTLVELLAVIVILAIIALITTPMIMGVIEKARKGAAISSAYGYVEAIENHIVESLIDSQPLKDGTYEVEELDSIEYKGKGPTQGYVEIKDMEVVNAHLCINHQSIDYDGLEVKESELSYCEEPTLTIIKNEKSTTQELGKENKTEIALEDTTNIKSVSCNNGTSVTIEEDTLKIEHIYGDTICRIDNSLKDSVNNLDNTKTTIIVINDTEVENTLTFKENTNVELDLNGKQVTGNVNLIENSGILSIYDSIGNGSIKSEQHVLINKSNGLANLTNINASCNNGSIQNSDNATVNIDGGKYISNFIAINNTSKGDAHITDKSGSVYVYTSGSARENEAAVKAIQNTDSGNIYIDGSIAESCLEGKENISGICIYNKNGRGVLNEVAATGSIYINGAYIVGSSFGINNFDIGNIYVCNGIISGEESDICNTYNINVYNGDLNNLGKIYYTSRVTLQHNKINSIPANHVVLDNTIHCK